MRSNSAVQPRQRQLTDRARTAERQQPLRRLIVWPAAASARTSSQRAARRTALGSGGVNWWHAYRSYEVGSGTRSGTRLRAGKARPGRNLGCGDDARNADEPDRPSRCVKFGYPGAR